MQILKIMTKKTNKKPLKSSDILVNQKMLFDVRDELKSDISSLEHRMNARFNDQKVEFDIIKGQFAQVDERFAQVDERFTKIDQRFAQVDERFAQIDQRFAQVDERFAQIDQRFAQVDERFDRIEARLDRVESKIDDVKASVKRIEILVEKQANENRYVIDMVINLNDRQDRFEKEIRKDVADIKSIISLSPKNQ